MLQSTVPGSVPGFTVNIRSPSVLVRPSIVVGGIWRVLLTVSVVKVTCPHTTHQSGLITPGFVTATLAVFGYTSGACACTQANPTEAATAVKRDQDLFIL